MDKHTTIEVKVNKCVKFCHVGNDDDENHDYDYNRYNYIMTFGMFKKCIWEVWYRNAIHDDNCGDDYDDNVNLYITTIC